MMMSETNKYLKKYFNRDVYLHSILGSLKPKMESMNPVFRCNKK